MANDWRLKLDRDQTSPARSAVAVTVSDSTTYTPTPRGLYVGVGGDVAVILTDDGSTAATFKNVPSGTILPIKPYKVMSTNTTATNILALY